MDPKLIQARAEIQAVLEKHDIAGHVVLHNTPNQLEVFMHLTPSYSRVQMVGCERTGLGVRIRSKLADYKGDVVAQRRDLEATAGMVHGLATVLAQDGMTMLQVADVVNNATGAQHTPMSRADGPAQ